MEPDGALAKAERRLLPVGDTVQMKNQTQHKLYRFLPRVHKAVPSAGKNKMAVFGYVVAVAVLALIGVLAWIALGPE